MTTDAVPSDLPGVVLAGTASGVGKTVATLAVCRALERAGRTPVAAKAGPDFIDPSHHAAVLDRPSRTLDPWLAGERGVQRAYARGADDGDVCVVEGMMGLYDGDVSTAAVAAALDLPVVLVVDASAGMESVAATALGFQQYAERAGYDVDVVGLLAARGRFARYFLAGRPRLFVRFAANVRIENPDRPHTLFILKGWLHGLELLSNVLEMLHDFPFDGGW
jgi:cobyrinic acid a,c-diamide synthase